MRKTLVALTATTALAFSLAGCTAPTPNTTKASAASCDSAFDADSPTLDRLTFGGEVGSLPEVVLPNPLQIPSTERSVLIEGDGPLITDTTQLAQVVVYGATSTSGEILGVLAGANSSQPNPVDSWSQYATGLTQQLLCVQEGSRVAITLPNDAVTPDFVEAYDLGEGQGAVFIVDVLKVVPKSATGADVFNAQMGLPAVIRDTNGRPGLVMPKGDAPSSVVVQTLLKGDGEPLVADSQFYSRVLGVGWHGATPFISTWTQANPTVTSVQAFPPAVADALEGATVGSQVMVIIPASEISPEQIVGTTVPADTALVYVVDILAAAS